MCLCRIAIDECLPLVCRGRDMRNIAALAEAFFVPDSWRAWPLGRGVLHRPVGLRPVRVANGSDAQKPREYGSYSLFMFNSELETRRIQ